MSTVDEQAEEFLLQNETTYEIINTFQLLLMNLTEDTYKEAMELVQSNTNIFFKNHERAILFFYFIILYSRFNYKNFEIILDICVNFKEEIKKANATEYELIRISMILPNSIYYLFSKNFFSIESIIEESTYSIFLFIYFLPEIEQYDSEYAKKREMNFINDSKNEKELLFYEFVKSNPEKHILYRKINYHPSNLHKSIRDDDINSFQSILALNNYDINHRILFSYYERVMTHDENISLIQAAAIYGSEKIFKFLWMKNDIIFDNNLLKYAFCGKNLNIIHLCETKCSFEQAYTEPIATQNFDILDYYIEMFGDKIEEYNLDVKEKLQNFHEKNEDNSYSVLNYDALLMVMNTFNYTLIKECLPKIIFIAKNSDFNEENEINKSLMNKCQLNFELYKFIYDQKKNDVNPVNCQCCVYSLIDCLYNCANDSFKFMFSKLKNSINISYLFEKSLMLNHDIANYLLDIQIEEKNSNKIDEDSIFKKLKNQYFNSIIFAIQYYNEDIIVKLMKLIDINSSSFNATEFVECLDKNISDKMITSLMNKFSALIPKSELNNMDSIYKSIKTHN